ncbi:hypothetical protein M0R72_19120 [Candidatus Pacearchaeota archaeon]|nr:hypothetical protein [Candidatus Pacearchaeota archaeon]
MVEWFLEDSSGVEYAIDVDEYGLTRFYDEGKVRPSEASITVPRRVPALDKQWIRMVDDGQTRFLGYLSRKPTISSIHKKILVARGVEALLWECPCPVLSYAYNSTTMTQLFSDAAYPGLIYAANSHIPPGWLEDSRPAETVDEWLAHGPAVIYDETNAIVKYENCGTKSRMGSTAINVNGVAYTNYASYALMAAADRATYRDAEDLYIHFWSGGAPEYGYRNLPLFAANAFDTRVRRGVIDSTYTFNTPIQVGPENMVGDMLAGIATVHGLNLRPRYVGKLCYLDALEDFSDDGIFDIPEEHCTKINFKNINAVQLSALTGLGAGPRLFKQVQSILDVTPGGAFIRDTVDCEKGYYDADGNLCVLATNEWEAIRSPEVVEIETDMHDYIPLGADARLLIEGEKTNTYQVRKVAKNSKSSTKIELGARSKDILDAMAAQSAVGNAYATEEMPEFFTPGTKTGVLTIGATNKTAVPFVSSAFAMPAWATVSAYNPRVLLDLSLTITDGYIFAYNTVAQFKVAVGTDTTWTQDDSVLQSETPFYIVAKDDLNGIDITRKITWGTNNYLYIITSLLGALANAGDFSDLNVSAKIYMVGRRELS